MSTDGRECYFDEESAPEKDDRDTRRKTHDTQPFTQ